MFDERIIQEAKTLIKCNEIRIIEDNKNIIERRVFIMDLFINFINDFKYKINKDINIIISIIFNIIESLCCKSITKFTVSKYIISKIKTAINIPNKLVTKLFNDFKKVISISLSG